MLRQLKLPLVRPYRVSFRTYTEFEPIVVEIRDTDGGVGWGEAYIPAGSTAETADGAWGFCRDFAARLLGRSVGDAKSLVDKKVDAAPFAACALLSAHPEYRQSPVAMFEAAKRDRPDVLALLLELGFSLEIQDPTGKRPLHEAAAAGALRAAAFLIEQGAEIDPRESSYGGAPIGWAAHGDKTEMVRLLSRYSRNLWTLCFHGYVDRVREILAEDPARARIADDHGVTPLWWLPDDEEQAMQVVELLLAAGADPSAKSADGLAAADWARRRGMRAVAARLEIATATSHNRPSH